jgi:hypothetical protein
MGQNGVPEVNVNVNYNVTDEVSADNIYPVTSRGVKAALDDLDFSSVGGDGKYISAISETDGKINATETIMDLTPTDNSTKAVTSGGIKSAIDKVKDIMSSLPTDAVLHYSFDDVPDYPNGNADVRLLDNNTYGLQNTNYRFSPNTFSSTVNENGKLKVSTNSGISNQWFIYMPTQPLNKIVKFRFTITSIDDNTGITVRNGSDTIVGGFNKVGTYDVVFVSNATGQYPSVMFYVAGGLVTLVFDEIYIGDGSYSTPIIDNANGQNNATNNGGIAVQGVSGKGAYFLNGKYADLGVFNLSSNFTVSIWVKPDNATVNLTGEILHINNQLLIRNGSASPVVNNMLIEFYLENQQRNTFSFNSLLSANVWTNIIIIKNNTNVKVYTNGVLVKDVTLVSANLRVSTINSYICKSWLSNTRPQSIDDLLIFDRALTENEVMALYLNKANTPKYYDINNYNLKQIKDITAQSTDFADFQSRMAGLATRSLQLIEPTEDER